MKIQKVCGATSVCVVIAARNESRAADNGQDLEFTDVERRAGFLKGDSRTVEALREPERLRGELRVPEEKRETTTTAKAAASRL